jgi:hypothetical protein
VEIRGNNELLNTEKKKQQDHFLFEEVGIYQPVLHIGMLHNGFEEARI